MPELLPPLTAEDLRAFHFLADAQLSPDGERVAFVVRTVDVDRDEYRSALGAVPADGSGPATPLTAGPGDSAPRWSPDGRWLAFLSDRAERSRETKDGAKPPKQVHVMPARGGEARALAALGDVSELVWSPASDGLVAVSKDRRDESARPGGVRVYDRIRYHRTAVGSRATASRARSARPGRTCGCGRSPTTAAPGPTCSATGTAPSARS